MSVNTSWSQKPKTVYPCPAITRVRDAAPGVGQLHRFPDGFNRHVGFHSSRIVSRAIPEVLNTDPRIVEGGFPVADTRIAHDVSPEDAHLRSAAHGVYDEPIGFARTGRPVGCGHLQLPATHNLW